MGDGAAQEPGGATGSSGGPRSYYLWGEPRVAVNLLGLALARDLDPDFAWIDVRGGAGERPDAAPPRIPEGERHFVYAARQIAPQPSVPGPTLDATLRPDPQGPRVDRVADFARIPAIVQELLARRGAWGFRVLYVSNTDFTQGQYAPGPGGFLPFLRSLAAEGVSFVAARCGDAPPNRFDFDHVLRLERDPGAAWAAARLRIEKAPAGARWPSTGGEMPLAAMPGGAEIAGFLDPGRSRAVGRAGANR